MSDKELLTTKEVCEILKTSRQVISRAVKSGKLKAHKVGSQYRFYMADVKEYMNRREQ